MNEVFISYKREDEARVVRLVRALERAALSVWWDRGLAGGENWPSGIQEALDRARCVIVVWTRESVGPAGDFVRDEALQAKRRGVLVPVMLDKVDPPLGFGEIQAIDLTGWKGSARDPFFADLVAAVSARLEGRAAPPAKAPMKRLIRRVTWSSVGSVGVFGVVAFGLNLFGAQGFVCGIPMLQPGVSDACGAMGLGGRPGKSERIAWAAREPGSCAWLSAFVERFRDGAYRGEAMGLLAARRVTETEVWTQVKHGLVMFEARGEVGSVSKAAAQAAALARARAGAERLCKGFAATASFRLRSAGVAAQVWDCGLVGGGVTCGFEGEAVCELDQRGILERESCGK
jgi:hypothetical protein